MLERVLREAANVQISAASYRREKKRGVSSWCSGLLTGDEGQADIRIWLDRTQR
jgi:hypothetical protein